MRPPARYLAGFVPIKNLRTEFTAAAVGYDIAGVSGFADRRYAAFGGLSADIRYRILDRATAPFGFAIGAEPHWGRADDITGEPVSRVRQRLRRRRRLGDHPRACRCGPQPHLSARNRALEADRYLVAESTAGIALAVMAQVKPGIFVGGEARYLRQYDGFGLDMFAGQGFFIGPTIYFKLSERAWITAAWSAQVAGQATTVPGSLDLVNFERRQARLLFGVSF